MKPRMTFAATALSASSPQRALREQHGVKPPAPDGRRRAVHARYEPRCIHRRGHLGRLARGACLHECRIFSLVTAEHVGVQRLRSKGGASAPSGVTASSDKSDRWIERRPHEGALVRPPFDGGLLEHVEQGANSLEPRGAAQRAAERETLVLGVEMRERVEEEREASGVVAEQLTDERTRVRRLGANQLLPERPGSIPGNRDAASVNAQAAAERCERTGVPHERL